MIDDKRKQEIVITHIFKQTDPAIDYSFTKYLKSRKISQQQLMIIEGENNEKIFIDHAKKF